MDKKAKAPDNDVNKNLIDILQGIEEDGAAVPAPTPTPVPAPIPVSAPVPIELPKPKPEIIEPTLETAIDTVPTSHMLDAVPAEPPKDDKINHLMDRFNDSVDTIIGNQQADRDQVEDAIQYVRELLKNSTGADNKIPVSLVEQLVGLLKVKTDINANATGVLDSIAKMIAAGKNNDLIIGISNKVQAPGSFDLNKILSQPVYEDEEERNR